MKKLVLIVLILVGSMVLMPISVYAQENSVEENLTDKEKKSSIKALNEKYILKKTVTAGEPFDWDYTSIEILNIGNETATIKDIKKSQFFVKDASYKLSDTSIDKDKINVLGNLPVSLKPGESTKFDITSDEKSVQAGIYSGKLILLGNFDALDVNIDVIIKQNPHELMTYTVIGIIIASVLSFILKIGMNYWINPPAIKQDKGLKKFGKCLFVSASQLTMAETRKPTVKIELTRTDHIHQITETEKKESDTEEKSGPGKILLQAGYSVAVALAAIPVTLFAQGVLTGDPVIDNGIAVGIGASLYGTKDLIGELKTS